MWSEEAEKKFPSCFCPINIIHIVCMSESKGQTVFSYNQPLESSRHTAGSRFQQSPCMMWDWLSVEHRKAEETSLQKGQSAAPMSLVSPSHPQSQLFCLFKHHVVNVPEQTNAVQTNSINTTVLTNGEC